MTAESLCRRGVSQFVPKNCSAIACMQQALLVFEVLHAQKESALWRFLAQLKNCSCESV